MKYVKKLWPLIFILLLVGIAYFGGLWDYVSFERLKVNKLNIEQFVALYPIWTPIFYILIYAFLTMLPLSGIFILTLVSGFLWPQPFSTFFVLIGATIGACISFLAARYMFYDFFNKKADRILEKMRQGFQDNQISYLLSLRLIPFVPFWIINLVPAFFNVRFINYVWTTFLGIVPSSYFLTQAGRGLNQILETEEGFALSTFFNFEMKIALVGLSALSLISILIQKLRSKKGVKDE